MSETQIKENTSTDNEDSQKSTFADQFNLDKLRLPQDFQSEVSAKKVITATSVRKSNRHEFIRVRSGEEWRLLTLVLEMKGDREEIFLVDPSLWTVLAAELTPRRIVIAINRQGVIFLWPIRLPGSDGRQNLWNDTALECASLAEEKWISVKSNIPLGAYEGFEAQGKLSEPDWPDISFEELVRLAFKDKFIQDEADPVIRRLRGEI